MTADLPDGRRHLGFSDDVIAKIVSRDELAAGWRAPANRNCSYVPRDF